LKFQGVESSFENTRGNNRTEAKSAYVFVAPSS
jgi:hypothetical protein